MNSPLPSNKCLKMWEGKSIVTGRQHLDFSLPSTAILKLSTAWTISFFPGCGFSNNLTIQNRTESGTLFYGGFSLFTQIRDCVYASLHLIPCLISLNNLNEYTSLFKHLNRGETKQFCCINVNGSHEIKLS